MNKPKQVVRLKHRRKQKKFKERKKNLKAQIELAEEILKKRNELPAGLRSEIEGKLAAARSALSEEGENFRKKLSVLRLRAQELEQLLTGL